MGIADSDSLRAGVKNLKSDVSAGQAMQGWLPKNADIETIDDIFLVDRIIAYKEAQVPKRKPKKRLKEKKGPGPDLLIHVF